MNVDIKVVGGSSSKNRTSFSLPFSSNDFNINFILMIDLHFILCELLVSWRVHLVLGLQIYPELKAKRELFRRCGNLRMDNTSTSSHPLNVARSYLSLMAFKILMVKTSLEHIGNSLKTSMGVIGKSSRKSYLEEVKHEKRVKISEMLITNDSNNSSTLSLVLPVRFENECHAKNIKISPDNDNFHQYYNFFRSFWEIQYFLIHKSL